MIGSMANCVVADHIIGLARWTVRPGETLMQTLRRWGERTGVAVFRDACPTDDRDPLHRLRSQDGGDH